ncbi:hypothetical protein B0O80DRAFT_456008 [Mortierella sp. GBAus27b]|nr:hypothetical protein B0O80DRAFT_455910 [Mortierella sp. GBAus27b]KAI8351731.1 hypothetical protein B0O80DRAFT_456008 [Mortierella sp. GBAus27b]
MLLLNPRPLLQLLLSVIRTRDWPLPPVSRLSLASMSPTRTTTVLSPSLLEESSCFDQRGACTEHSLPMVEWTLAP